MTSPKKLVQAAEWLMNNGDPEKESYYAGMHQRLAATEITERDEFYYQEIESVIGFEGVLDIVFNEDPHIQNDGLEGLREAVIRQHTEYIQNRAEHGHRRASSFKDSLEGKPSWFIRQVASAELDDLPAENQMAEPDLHQYRDYLEMIVESDGKL